MNPANYAEQNAITLPGRIPGYKNDDIQLLSSCDSKTHVWKAYTTMCQESSKKAVCYTKFIELWGQFHPNVVVAKPRTDLCMTCQQNTCKLQSAINLSDAEKSECVRAQQAHLDCAQGQRDCYRDACKKESEELGQSQDVSGIRNACSWKATIHYSFDYAQQVHIPSNPMQPGPIYFKAPRKCGIFGVICEAIPQHEVDEVVATGKGANATMSCLHYYFEKQIMKQMCIYMPIIVRDRTRTIILFGI